MKPSSIVYARRLILDLIVQTSSPLYCLALALSGILLCLYTARWPAPKLR